MITNVFQITIMSAWIQPMQSFGNFEKANAYMIRSRLMLPYRNVRLQYLIRTYQKVWKSVHLYLLSIVSVVSPKHQNTSSKLTCFEIGSPLVFFPDIELTNFLTIGNKPFYLLNWRCNFHDKVTKTAVGFLAFKLVDICSLLLNW